MKTNAGFTVTKIKQLGDRIFEKILSRKILMHLMAPRAETSEFPADRDERSVRVETGMAG